VPESATQAMAAGPVPMVIGLHGAGDNGSNFIQATGLTSTADAMGFVMVGPEGYNSGWFVQSNEGWPGTDGYPSSLQNDMDLMLRIIDDVGDDYHLDAGRVYAVGHSRGAGFTALMAILSSQGSIASGPWSSPFAAYGINAGYDPFGGHFDPGAASPKAPVWIVHGSSDGNVPYSYGQSLAQDLQGGGWDVEFTTVQGAGHVWLWRSQYGQSNEDLVEFFLENRL
jgi:poly(3-hydroxybutyrate) depolymerase